MDLELSGIHHLTAITAHAGENLRFYTDTLGLRLVKKTVNQDDTSAYHLFYGDGRGSPGSDVTFFDWPVGREQRGTHASVRTGLRVSGSETLGWWGDRLRAAGLVVGDPAECDGRASLAFDDPEGQRLLLVDGGGAGEAHAWEGSRVPAEYQVRGLGPITIRA
jgi:glyoxalase family protein